MKQGDVIGRTWVNLTLAIAVLAAISYLFRWAPVVSGILTILSCLLVPNFVPGTRLVRRLLASASARRQRAQSRAARRRLNA
jgi:hypothetical protein